MNSAVINSPVINSAAINSTVGILALDLAVSIVLFSITTALILRSYNQLIITSREIEQQTEKVFQASTYIGLFDSLMRDGETISLQNNIVIHENGKIKLFNGSEVSITPQNQPNKKSNAISARRVKTSLVLTRELEINQNNIFCKIFNDKIVAKDLSYLLGISASGQFTFLGEPISISDSCWLIELTPVDSIFSEMPANSEATIDLVVPIEYEKTIYISTSEDLRLLSHKGREITENQPIISKFIFLPRVAFNKDIHEIELELDLQGRSLIKTSRSKRAPDHTPLEILLNIP